MNLPGLPGGPPMQPQLPHGVKPNTPAWTDLAEADPIADLKRWSFALLRDSYLDRLRAHLLSWPHDNEHVQPERQAWIDEVVVPEGLRAPTELRAMPSQGKVVIAAPARWQAAAYAAATVGLDYFLNDLCGAGEIYIVDVDTWTLERKR